MKTKAKDETQIKASSTAVLELAEAVNKLGNITLPTMRGEAALKQAMLDCCSAISALVSQPEATASDPSDPEEIV